MTRYAVEYPVGDGTWWTGHKSMELRDPEAYARKAGARVTPVEECPVCETYHKPPYDGSCLLG